MIECPRSHVHDHLPTITYLSERHHQLQEDRQQIFPQLAVLDATNERDHLFEQLVPNECLRSLLLDLIQMQLPAHSQQVDAQLAGILHEYCVQGHTHVR